MVGPSTGESRLTSLKKVPTNKTMVAEPSTMALTTNLIERELMVVESKRDLIDAAPLDVRSQAQSGQIARESP